MWTTHSLPKVGEAKFPEPSSLTVTDLAPGSTYYWRVDEVGNETTVGDVWSFTTGPDIPVEDVALAAYWDMNETPSGYLVDSSGHHRHGKLVGEPNVVPGFDDSNALTFDGTGNLYGEMGDCINRRYLHFSLG